MPCAGAEKVASGALCGTGIEVVSTVGAAGNGAVAGAPGPTACEAASELEKKIGERFTVLVNNAGHTADALLMMQKWDDVERLLQVHLHGAIRGLRALSVGRIGCVRGAFDYFLFLHRRLGLRQNPGETTRGVDGG